mmetsp:Transcript_15488/g.24098  ORF Transcript_15488/g.24098 Transcript_15488/m.24098 type:complete len:81 (-) Transcript_15488:45-287(-)
MVKVFFHISGIFTAWLLFWFSVMTIGNMLLYFLWCSSGSSLLEQPFIVFCRYLEFLLYSLMMMEAAFLLNNSNTSPQHCC